MDAAQTAGHCPIDAEATAIDLLAAPGHKGLLGPSGTGVLYVGPRAEARMTTVREGGTGSRSELAVQPGFLPDRFEAGSHNAHGIAGLLAAARWIEERGVATLRAHERTLIDAMLEAIENTPGVELIGPAAPERRCAVFSVRVRGRDGDPVAPGVVARALERDHGLLTRAGLHLSIAKIRHRPMAIRP